MVMFPFSFPSIHSFSSLCHYQEVDPRWSEYQSRFSSLLQWSRQHTGLMANKNFPQNPVELKVSMCSVFTSFITFIQFIVACL